MEDPDSLELSTQIEFANLIHERNLYKLKYAHLCAILNRIHDEHINKITHM